MMGSTLISPLSNLTNLRVLDATDNDITDISALLNLTKLTELYLNQNKISDISHIFNLVNLVDLRLTGNQISNVAPLSSLAKLEMLYLDNNQISEIESLSGLVSLGGIPTVARIPSKLLGYKYPRRFSEGAIMCLFLANNQISDISPLVQNSGISKYDGIGDGIDLTGNPLNEVSLNTYIPQLQSRGARVYYDIQPGDTNGDGVLSAPDITKLERVIAGLDVETAGADANGDGAINALDITKVERLIAHLD